jgi:hypothetical protein
MGQVVTLSDAAADYVIFGNKGPMLGNFLQEQLSRIQPAYNDLSNRVYGALQSSYNFVNDRMVQWGILNQIQQAGMTAVDNYYQECLSFQQLQSANYTMQRWVMSHPEVRQLYLDQDLDGYSDTYKNVFGNDVGNADYNYRRVTDEVLVDGPNDTSIVRYHLDDLMEGDRELGHNEKVNILHTYDAIDHILSSCKFDFTHVGEEPPKINR